MLRQAQQIKDLFISNFQIATRRIFPNKFKVAKAKRRVVLICIQQTEVASFLRA